MKRFSSYNIIIIVITGPYHLQIYSGSSHIRISSGLPIFHQTVGETQKVWSYMGIQIYDPKDTFITVPLAHQGNKIYLGIFGTFMSLMFDHSGNVYITVCFTRIVLFLMNNSQIK